MSFDRAIAICQIFNAQIRSIFGPCLSRKRTSRSSIKHETHSVIVQNAEPDGSGGKGPVSEKPGGLNGSVQHWLEVYSQEFQNPRSLAAVDSDAGLFCPGRIA